ncbi:hypothetical protein C8P63_12154 [Melghirimyces profundicolus]|uniref:Uncharacterized protein n=1 Tax=Melghirimyces profundicolus TaxID=1242148 RepID=A0A2T6BGI9_9BACL|nr:hypothetical protein C8P63_12154 [Melghirimyces profundicolus]
MIRNLTFRRKGVFSMRYGYGYGFGLRRLLLFLLVIATIFALIPYIC